MRRRQDQAEPGSLPSISSQLYGMPTNQVAGTSNPPSRLHQVPIHIYPGMQTAPLPSDSPSFQPQPHPQPPVSMSVHLSPIQNQPTSAAGSDTYSLPFSKPASLSNFLDLSALDATRIPSLYSEESNGPDEHIDFDALWAWPSNTPAVGSPRVNGDGGINNGLIERVQGVSDSAVPLFGVVRNDSIE
jgi:hypothetical protein